MSVDLAIQNLPNEEMLTVDEIAKHFRVDRRLVLRELRADKFPGAVKIGKQWRVPKVSITEYLRENR